MALSPLEQGIYAFGFLAVILILGIGIYFSRFGEEKREETRRSRKMGRLLTAVSVAAAIILCLLLAIRTTQ